MEEYTKCKEAIEACQSGGRFAVAHLYNEEKTMELHIHNCCEIYYAISGARQFFINDRRYDIAPGNVFLINHFESHCLSQLGSTPHERLVFSIHPEYLNKVSTPNTRLSDCFYNRSDPYSHKLNLTWEQQSRFLALAHKITSACGFGADVVEDGACAELLVMMNRLYRSGDSETLLDMGGITTERTGGNKLVDKVLNYINGNLAEKLQLSDIAKKFYVSETYICRVFKAETGTTLNKYITARRISVAKALLADGMSVTDTCERSGWGDYSNFVKAFTKAVGVSPKRYGKYGAI